ncbi:phage tail spike protein [Enterococcus sp. AZ126]|uniref:phage tail spike protein n=1 Tax=Enterococcus sp. AZ126 TaxID=2774635 RepID=UPI003F2033CB
MYRITLYSHATDKEGLVVHEPANYGNKIVSGELDLSLEGIGISTFDFAININNPAYRKIEPIINMVVVQSPDKSVLFRGRVAKITNAMDGDGNFVEKILCEDQKAYLYDSTQNYLKPQLMTVSNFLERALNTHNSQVDAYKKIYLGKVTVNDDEPVYRGFAYGKTAEVIKDKLLDRLGGYFILRTSAGRLYLDYLADYGSESTTPLQITKNLKSAERDIDVAELVTRIVPLGQDIETSSEIDIGTDFSRPKVTIGSLNNGKDYLVDQKLVDKFGVIQGEVEFPNITDKYTLKRRGESYLRAQRLMLVTWTVEAIELGLLDSRYEMIQIGNSYPIENELLYGRESLQVIEKKIDILNPQRITLTIGTGKKTLSQYQLGYQGLQETLETVKGRITESGKNVADLQAQAIAFNEKTIELDQATAVIPELQTNVTAQGETLSNQGTTIQAQQVELAAQNSNLQKQQKEIDDLKKIIEELQKK